MASQPLRRVAEAQLCDGPLHGVQRVAPRGGQEALAAGPLEQPCTYDLVRDKTSGA
jgi:hypothetical protein